MKINFVSAAAIGGLATALMVGLPANATPTTVDFTVLDNSTTVATGALTYSGSGPITSFAGFTAFNITFDKPPSATDTYTYSELTGVPTGDTFVDFNTSTNQFQFGDSPAFYNEDALLGADNGSNVNFFIYNSDNGAPGDFVYEDNALSIYGGAWTNITYSVVNPLPVPEPWTLALFGAGLLGLGMMVRRRKAIAQG
jgi:hypothetical protein